MRNHTLAALFAKPRVGASRRDTVACTWIKE
jgi:hypothetical protein